MWQVDIKTGIKQSMLGIEARNTMTMIIQATQMLQPHLSRWFGKIPNELVVPLKTALAAYYTIAYTHLVYLSIQYSMKKYTKAM